MAEFMADGGDQRHWFAELFASDGDPEFPAHGLTVIHACCSGFGCFIRRKMAPKRILCFLVERQLYDRSVDLHVLAERGRQVTALADGTVPNTGKHLQRGLENRSCRSISTELPLKPAEALLDPRFVIGSDPEARPGYPTNK